MRYRPKHLVISLLLTFTILSANHAAAKLAIDYDELAFKAGVGDRKNYAFTSFYHHGNPSELPTQTDQGLVNVPVENGTKMTVKLTAINSTNQVYARTIINGVTSVESREAGEWLSRTTDNRAFWEDYLMLCEHTWNDPNAATRVRTLLLGDYLITEGITELREEPLEIGFTIHGFFYYGFVIDESAGLYPVFYYTINKSLRTGWVSSLESRLIYNNGTLFQEINVVETLDERRGLFGNAGGILGFGESIDLLAVAVIIVSGGIITARLRQRILKKNRKSGEKV